GTQQRDVVLAEELQDVLVARRRQSLLRSEVVDHELGRHPRCLRDRPHRRSGDPVRGELGERRIADPGGRRAVPSDPPMRVEAAALMPLSRIPTAAPPLVLYAIKWTVLCTS